MVADHAAADEHGYFAACQHCYAAPDRDQATDTQAHAAADQTADSQAHGHCDRGSDWDGHSHSAAYGHRNAACY